MCTNFLLSERKKIKIKVLSAGIFVSDRISIEAVHIKSFSKYCIVLFLHQISLFSSNFFYYIYKRTIFPTFYSYLSVYFILFFNYFVFVRQINMEPQSPDEINIIFHDLLFLTCTYTFLISQQLTISPPTPKKQKSIFFYTIGEWTSYKLRFQLNTFFVRRI